MAEATPKLSCGVRANKLRPPRSRARNSDGGKVGCGMERGAALCWLENN
jgi:hypothetical protein